MRDWKSEVRRRLHDLQLAPARESDIVEEMAQHLEDRYGELLSRGMTDAEARGAALTELASTDVLAEAMRNVDRAPRSDPPVLGAAAPSLWRAIWRDVGYGLRSLRKSPGFTSITILTLSLSIGASVAIFSIVNTVLLRPLPFPGAERTVAFWGTAPEKGLPEVRFPDALVNHFSVRSRSLDHVTAFSSDNLVLTGFDEPELINGTSVTMSFFSLLGARALHGRTFVRGEDVDRKNLVAVISHKLWQRRFGGKPEAVGTLITLNGLQGVVVGIMPPEFDFPNRTDAWVPLPINPQSLDCWCFQTIGRLRAGFTPDDAAADIAGLSDDFWREREPGAVRTERSVVVAKPLARVLTGEVRTPLLVLFGAVGMVLLIACANIANLLLARGTARNREIALRCCLGATRARVVRQLLIESMLLAVVGALGGLALAAVSVDALGRVVLERVTYLQRIELDLAVVAFAITVAVGAGLLFGVLPALRATRVDLVSSLKDGGRGSRGGMSRRLNHGFVVTQIAFSLMLLVGAALLLRSFRNLLVVDPGFGAENVLVARVSLPYQGYQEPERVRDLYSRLADGLRGLPGVRAVALTETAPFSQGGNQMEFVIQGREPSASEATPVASNRSVTSAYFQAIGTPILRGRAFTDSDKQGARFVAIVDETLARRYWPDGDAVGRRVRLGGSSNPWLTIVGVAKTGKHGSLGALPDHYVYVPFAQSLRWSMDLIVRTAAKPERLTAAVRRELRALDPQLPLYDVHTLEQAVSDSLSTRRLMNVLLSAFAIAALLLAAIGISGVMTLEVASRTPEFGIRLALGAEPGEVRSLVLRQAMRLVLLGMAAGLVGAAGITRILGSMLFNVQPVDPVTFSGVAILLTTVALAACYIPVRRATATDPLQALRAD